MMHPLIEPERLDYMENPPIPSLPKGGNEDFVLVVTHRAMGFGELYFGGSTAWRENNTRRSAALVFPTTGH